MASEMTNEQIANALEAMSRYDVEWASGVPDIYRPHLREAAAILRKLDGLNAKLKVAEDAMAKLQDRFVSSVHDGTIDTYEALKIAEDALAAIREEGGAK